MRPRRGSAGARRKALGLPGLTCIVLSLGVLACGVPLGAAELTATAESGGDAIADCTQRAASSGLLGAQATTPPRPSATPSESDAVPDGTSTPAAEATPSETATPSPQNVDLAAELVGLINSYRTGKGLGALQVNQALSAAAAGYARYMAETNFFGHTGPDGSTAQSRLAAAGYAGRYRGEALAAGQTSARDVLTVWLNSATHAAILLDSAAVDVGIGYFYSGLGFYGYYWTLNTGVP